MQSLIRLLYLFAIVLNLLLVACVIDQADDKFGSVSQELGVSDLNLKMPFPGGENWQLTRAYNDSTHTNYGGQYSDDRFAIDLVGNACTSLGKPVLAAAAGTVEVMAPSGYGNSVLVHHGDGWSTRVAHLASIAVTTGQTVRQGQRLGIIGNTGNVFGSACSLSPGMHIHFALYHNGVGVAPTPISGYSTLSPSTYYTSNNYEQAFDFNPGIDNVYACSDRVNTSNFTCQNRQTVFQSGQNVNMVVRVDNLSKNIAFSIEAWRVGRPTADWTWTDPAYQVEPNVWQAAFYLPRFDNVYPGDWEMKIFTNTGDGPVYLTSFRFFVPGTNLTPYQNGNSYHCKDGVTGGASTNWIYTCNGQQSSYTQGDIVSVMTRIDNVTSSHRFRARVFYNGSHLYTTNPSVWNDVPTGQTWQYAHFWTNISASAGSYEVRTDIDLPGGADFENVNVAIVPFTVSAGTPPPPYVYNGNNQTCANEPTGGQSTNWIYTCPNPTSTFSQGQNIRVFVFAENVRQSYRFRARFYRDGVYYNEITTDETTVPSGQVWSRAYTWPGLWGAPSGNWRASLEIHTASSGWQTLQNNITFTVNAPIGGYSSGSFKVCLGNPDNERNASGVPVCLNEVPVTNPLSPLSAYYWRLQFTGLSASTNIRYRIEAYHNGVYAWSWDFGPYAPVNGQAWFWPKFVNPGPGNWELLFFAAVGNNTFQQVEADSFFSF